jgi:two-component system chemotaxis sensor kinase CheA
VKKSSKFQIEAHAILLKMKIALQEFEKNPKETGHQDAVLEIVNQLAESAAIYGINTILELTSKISGALMTLQKENHEPDDDFVDAVGKSADLFGALISDPMLNNAGLKKDYDRLLEHCQSVVTSPESDEAKMATSRFQDVFTDEAFDLINQLEEKLLQLECDPSDVTMIDSVFRIMHTLKGNSNMFGFKELASITHELENIYDDIRGKKISFSQQILESTLLCVDHFRHLINDPDLSSVQLRVHHEELLDKIRRILMTDDKERGDRQVISEAGKNKTLHTYYLYFKPGKNIFDDGTNPLYFVYDLHELGEYLPVVKIDIPGEDFSPDKCYASWHIMLVTDHNDAEVREHFMFLREESQPLVQVLREGNLLENPEFTDQFKKQAGGSEQSIAPDILMQESEKVADHHEQRSEGNGTSKESISSVRVASAKIDQMMNLISELVTKQAELSMLALGQSDTRLVEVAEHIESISRDLRDNAFSISLIPLEKSVLRFQRLVRDVSNRFEKKVDFIVEGKETELDKTIIEKIIDPIMHILRNSIDHGIEKPAVRLQKGKPETGIIKLKAYPSGAHVVIEISDDGSGINLERVRALAISKGMIQKSDQISNDDLLRLIVSPGFSTAENISEVSGRGVGMDVVNQKITEIRGELEIDTRQDVGTTISIRLPLTISIIDSLLMKIDSDYFIVPLAVVDRCAEVRAGQVVNAQSRYITLNGEYIPFVDLRDEFEIKTERPAVQQMLLVRYKDFLVGIVVDEIIGNYQAVLKSLGESFKKLELISGASILGSGQIALVLDTTKIIQEYAMQNEDRINAMS